MSTSYEVFSILSLRIWQLLKESDKSTELPADKCSCNRATKAIGKGTEPPQLTRNASVLESNRISGTYLMSWCDLHASPLILIDWMSFMSLEQKARAVHVHLQSQFCVVWKLRGTESVRSWRLGYTLRRIWWKCAREFASTDSPSRKRHSPKTFSKSGIV